MAFATADLVDINESLPSCDLQFRSFGMRRAVHGPIATVSCFEDNALVKKVLSEPGHRRVLVVDGRGSLRCALAGDVITKLGADNGWAGLIVNGAVRDSDMLDAMDFAVKALGTNPRRSSKNGGGAVNIAVAFGGILFRPGDFLYSDRDGIIVSERRLI